MKDLKILQRYIRIVVSVLLILCLASCGKSEESQTKKKRKSKKTEKSESVQITDATDEPEIVETEPTTTTSIETSMKTTEDQLVTGEADDIVNPEEGSKESSTAKTTKETTTPRETKKETKADKPAVTEPAETLSSETAEAPSQETSAAPSQKTTKKTITYTCTVYVYIGDWYGQNSEYSFTETITEYKGKKFTGTWDDNIQNYLPDAGVQERGYEYVYETVDRIKKEWGVDDVTYTCPIFEWTY